MNANIAETPTPPASTVSGWNDVAGSAAAPRCSRIAASSTARMPISATIRMASTRADRSIWRYPSTAIAAMAAAA